MLAAEARLSRAAATTRHRAGLRVRRGRRRALPGHGASRRARTSTHPRGVQRSRPRRRRSASSATSSPSSPTRSPTRTRSPTSTASRSASSTATSARRNVMVTPAGRGQAARLRHRQARPAACATSARAPACSSGKLSYMSPEQADGLPRRSPQRRVLARLGALRGADRPAAVRARRASSRRCACVREAVVPPPSSHRGRTSIRGVDAVVLRMLARDRPATLRQRRRGRGRADADRAPAAWRRQAARKFLGELQMPSRGQAVEDAPPARWRRCRWRWSIPTPTVPSPPRAATFVTPPTRSCRPRPRRSRRRASLAVGGGGDGRGRGAAAIAALVSARPVASGLAALGAAPPASAEQPEPRPLIVTPLAAATPTATASAPVSRSAPRQPPHAAAAGSRRGRACSRRTARCASRSRPGPRCASTASSSAPRPWRRASSPAPDLHTRAHLPRARRPKPHRAQARRRARRRRSARRSRPALARDASVTKPRQTRMALLVQTSIVELEWPPQGNRRSSAAERLRDIATRSCATGWTRARAGARRQHARRRETPDSLPSTSTAWPP